MKFERNKSLQALNTFGFTQHAEHFCQPTSTSELSTAIEFAQHNDYPVFMLGGGSNLVLTRDIPGLTVQLRTQAITVEHDQHSVVVRCDAGLNWHQFVTATLHQGFFGLENLSLIPGNCGAAPIQNIGAYGVELADRLEQVFALDLATGDALTLSNNECEFGYRDSIFKRQLKGQVAITGMTLRLDTVANVNTGYRTLAEALERKGLQNPTPLQVSETVCAIRSSKLPDPANIGNAGSFFKNPVIEEASLTELRQQFPTLPSYRESPEHAKIPAAWLIEHCGWKGQRREGIGVHTEQALVLVHHGGSTGVALLELANDIKRSVKETFDITLEQEPVTL